MNMLYSLIVKAYIAEITLEGYYHVIRQTCD